MNTPGEDELLTGARALDLSSLAAIYDRYSPGLYTYALRLLGDACLAEDCVAETFSRFLKGLRAGGGPERHLQAYLYRVAHNWVTDFYRRQPPPPLDLNEEWQAEASAQPESQVDRRMEAERVRFALRSLTPDQRQVVILRFYEGWSNVEVAAAVEKSIGAVKALQHRALAALRKQLMFTALEGKDE